MYVNAKMIPGKTIPGMLGEKDKSVEDGMNPCMIYLIHFKNFDKCYNVPPPRKTI
jgi:hypothetical protein